MLCFVIFELTKIKKSNIMRLLKQLLLISSLVPSFLFAQRVKQSINTSWQFQKGVHADASQWKPVNIPHTWNAEDVMDDEKGYFRGVCWYEKTIFIPENWQDKDVYLHFEGASQLADVYVNGTNVGQHKGSYLAFNFNITKHIKKGENVIRVRLDNSHNPDIAPLGGDFSVYGGIYRDVYLVALEKNHFDMDNYATSGVFVSTPEVSKEAAQVQIKGKVVAGNKVKVRSVILDKQGKEVARHESTPKKDGSFELLVKNISSPHLWSPEDPYLYTVINTLVDTKTGEQYDEVTSPLGFRWFSIDAEKGFFLNGEPYKIMGASRHQDFKNLGYALPDALHVNDVEYLKLMGGNFLRVAHYPQDPAILEACDRLGILAAVETPGNNQVTENVAYAENMLDSQREMIRQNYNHPSVVIWSYMNEVLIQPLHQDKTPEREAYWKNVHDVAVRMDSITRAEDPSRYTMVAFHGDYNLYKRVGLIEIPQIAGWNLYQGWYSGEFKDFEKFVVRFHNDYPNIPFMITEYGSDSDYRLHNFNPTRFDKTQEYTNMYHEAYIETIMKYPYIAGGIIWNLVEFVNENREEAVPHVNNKGLMTTDRKPKDSYFIYKAELAKEPVLRIGGSDWLYRAQLADEGSNTQATQPITVYSNQESVSLTLNGELLGTQKVQNNKVVFTGAFKNGDNTIKAVSNTGLEELIHVNFHVIANELKSEENPFKTLNVSLGDKRMFEDDLTHECWVPEKEYTAGSWGYIGGKVYKDNENDVRYGSRRDILGTPYDAMYETQRIGIEGFKADVPDGVYEVTMHFSELMSDEQQAKLVYDLGAKDITETSAIGRKFDVLINGSLILEDLARENYLQPLRAYQTKTTVNVRNGKGITIDFKSKVGEAILNGIQFRKIY